MTEQLTNQLKSIIAQNLGIDESLVTEQAHLADDLGADSLDALHLLTAINESFNTTINPDLIDQVNTVADLINLIQTNK